MFTNTSRFPYFATKNYDRWSHQPLYTETLSILHKYCPKLVSLTIELPDQIEEQLGIAIESDWDQGNGLWELRPLFSATQDIPAFSNLQVLKFNNIYGDIVSQRSRLVTILLASPDLVELSLSVNADAMFRLNKTGRYDDYYYFLEDLCSLYAARGGKPLRLRSLFLGLCIYPWERHNLAIPPSLPREDLETYLNNLPKSPPATCVYKLTDLCTLQELSIHNGGHIYVLDLSDGSGIAWCTFTSSSCPELKSISIYLLTEETNNWLASELQHFTQLRIETSDDGYYPLFDLLNSGAGMPSTALPNSVASVASRPSVLVYEECLDLDDAEWFFPLLRVCNYLKGLKINLGSSYISSRSSADSGHSVQFFDAVKDLINLEELYIYSWKELSMDDDWWEELCTQVAYDTANAGLKLRCLKVGSTAWRIWRSEGQVRLETLDKYEQGNVQLFRSYFKY